VSAGRIAEYIAELRDALRGRLAVDATFIDEVADHLEDAADAAMLGGLPRHEAERQAIARFGDAAMVAELAAPGGARMRQLITFTCAATIAATVYLTVSLLVLHPPHADLGRWLPAAAFFIVQGGYTVTLVRRGGSLSSTERVLVAAGAIAIGYIGGAALVAARHAEGYALILGAMLAAQSMLTLVHVASRGTQRA
jgi:hypothetical protein